MDLAFCKVFYRLKGVALILAKVVVTKIRNRKGRHPKCLHVSQMPKSEMARDVSLRYFSKLGSQKPQNPHWKIQDSSGLSGKNFGCCEGHIEILNPY